VREHRKYQAASLYDLFSFSIKTNNPQEGKNGQNKNVLTFLLLSQRHLKNIFLAVPTFTGSTTTGIFAKHISDFFSQVDLFCRSVS